MTYPRWSNPQAPNCCTTPLPKVVSSASSVIGGIIPIVQSWEANPTGGSSKGNTLNHLEDVDRQIGALILDLGGEQGGGAGSGCSRHEKRGFLDGVTDIFKAAVDAVKCIGDVVKDIADNVNADNIAPVAGLLDNLTVQLKGLSNNNNDNDNDNDEDEDEEDNGEDDSNESISSHTST
ncbi:hypothetical protein BJX99DRAFT_264727 [Aspergillus californicus]